MTTDPNQTLHDQLQLFENVSRGTRLNSGICAESDLKTGLKTNLYDWVIREMPRSWRLELRAESKTTGLKSAHRAQTIQGALLRQLAGETGAEKQLFNYALKETARQYVNGVETWPSFDCPVNGNEPVDPWSENLWLCDSQILTSSFEKWIQPLRKPCP